MRSTDEIVEAVQRQEPVTEEELRLALLSVYYYAQLVTTGMGQHTPIAFGGDGKGLHAILCQSHYEDWFNGMKLPVDKRLGSRWTPGTPENRAGREGSERILAGFNRRAGR